MNENTPSAPKTIGEVGIYIQQISLEQRDLKVDVKEVKTIIQDLPNGFATKDDLAAFDKRIVKLENKENIKNTLLWVGLVASAIINIIALYDKFTQ